MCGSCPDSHHHSESDVGHAKIARWLKAFVAKWEPYSDRETLITNFMRTIRNNEKISDAIELFEFLREHKCKNDKCDCLREFRRMKDRRCADFERDLREFTRLHERHKEVEAELMRIKAEYFVETEANGGLARRRKFMAVVDSGNTGTAPAGFPELKPCGCCGEKWPATEVFFTRSAKTPDGLICYCRICNTKMERMRKRSAGYRTLIAEQRQIKRRMKELPFKYCDSCNIVKPRGEFADRRYSCNPCVFGRYFWPDRLAKNPDSMFWFNLDRQRAAKRRADDLFDARNAGAPRRDCYYCGESLPALTAFYYRTPDGVMVNACHPCNAEYKKHSEARQREKAAKYEAANADDAERFCPACGEWHPADRNHFYPNPSGCLSLFCKFCDHENRQDPAKSKIRQYRDRRRFAKWEIYEANGGREMQRCGCCGKTKLWCPANFPFRRSDSGLLGLVCSDCVDSGAAKIDRAAQAALAAAGRRQCGGCLQVKDLGEFNETKIYCCDGCGARERRLQIVFRLHTDDAFNAVCTVGRQLRKWLRRAGTGKDGRTHEIVGCSGEFLKRHLERSGLGLRDAGVQVDHRVPLSWAVVPGDAARTAANVKLLFHWSNLYLMTAEENLLKRARPLRVEDLPEELHPGIRAIYDRKIAEMKMKGEAINYYPN